VNYFFFEKRAACPLKVCGQTAAGQRVRPALVIMAFHVPYPSLVGRILRNNAPTNLISISKVIEPAPKPARSSVEITSQILLLSRQGLPDTGP